MELLLQRKLPIGEALPGELLIDSTHACYTLERVAVAIPSGRYEVTLYPSPHFGRPMPLLKDVPGRNMIEIHFGNYPEESDGCILVGEAQDPANGDTLLSREAFFKLFPAIETAIETEGAWITILDAQRTGGNQVPFLETE